MKVATLSPKAIRLKLLPTTRADVPAVPETSAQPDHAAMMESLPVPVVLLDPRDRIQYANSGAESFLGLSLSQLRSLGWPRSCRRTIRSSC